MLTNAVWVRTRRQGTRKDLSQVKGEEMWRQEKKYLSLRPEKRWRTRECREDTLTSGKLLLLNCNDGREGLREIIYGGENHWWRWNHRDGVEWVEGKSFLELSNIELKKQDGQNRVGRKKILFFSKRKTESRLRREKKRKAQAVLSEWDKSWLCWKKRGSAVEIWLAAVQNALRLEL